MKISIILLLRAFYVYELLYGLVFVLYYSYTHTSGIKRHIFRLYTCLYLCVYKCIYILCMRVRVCVYVNTLYACVCVCVVTSRTSYTAIVFVQYIYAGKSITLQVPIRIEVYHVCACVCVSILYVGIKNNHCHAVRGNSTIVTI